MSIARTVEPEWLDELAPHDPRAIRSRRDLRRINALMTNDAIVARELLRCLRGRRPRAIAEIGAGDGTFMLRLAARTAPRWQGTRVVLLDRHDAIGRETLEAFAASGWSAEVVAADACEWLVRSADRDFDVIVANLFLHHFDAGTLLTLLSSVARRTRTFIACEPRRSGFALAASRLLALAGCNDVSRHDAVVSVRAGFADAELSALWPAGSAWMLREHASGIFSHCFIASRVSEDDFARGPTRP